MISDMRKNIILIFAVTLISIHISAIPHYFTTFDMKSGLSNNYVSSIIQDKYGMIWIGTRNGLNRYDGNSFISYYSSNEEGNLINSQVNALTLSPDNELYISTHQGLERYDYENDMFVCLDFTRGVRVNNALFDNKKNIWTTINGYSLVKYNTETGLSITYQLNGEDITRIYITSKGKVWACSRRNIACFDEENNTFVPIEMPAWNDLNIMDITAMWVSDDESTIIVGTTMDGIKRIDLDAGIVQDILQKRESTPTYARSFYRSENRIYCATGNGIYIYDLETNHLEEVIKKNRNDKYSLSSNAIRAIFIDDEDGLWVSTDDGGINYAPAYSAFNRYYEISQSNTIHGEIIHDICQDDYGHIWIGTEDSGVNQYNLATGEYKYFDDSNGLSQDCIHGLVPIGRMLWVGTHVNGIDLLDIPTGRIVKHYYLTGGQRNNNIIVYMYKTTDDELLVATASGLYKYNPQKDAFDIQNLTFTERVQTICEDHEGTLWVGSTTGNLNRKRRGEEAFQSFIVDSLIIDSKASINHIIEDHNQNLWLATSIGLYMFNIKTDEAKPNKLNREIEGKITYRVEEDSQNRLWISTADGLIKYNTKTNTYETFRQEHGLPTNQFNYNSSLTMSDGKMYFGTLRGMIGFYPENISMITGQSKQYITELHIMNEGNNEETVINVLNQEQITLKNKNSTFYIEFVSPEYRKMGRQTYSYNMQGSSEQWITTNNNKAYFSGLPPGKYIFQLKALNLSDDWNNQPTMLEIVILPPWYQTTLAYIAYFIIGLLVISLFILSLKRQNRKKMKMLIDGFENEKEKEIYRSKIDFFINVAHEIRTPLTLIKLPLEKVINDIELPKKAEKYLTVIQKNTNRLNNLIDQLLDFRKTETDGYKLNFVNHDIIAIIDEMFARFYTTSEARSITMLFTPPVKEFYAYIDKEAFTKIISNLLNNAIKYADKKVVIKFFIPSDNHFAIDIMNDGEPIKSGVRELIFKPFYRAENAESRQGTGLGLPLAASLAKMHGGTLTLEDTDNGMTLFRLLLPTNHPEAISFKIKEEELPAIQESEITYPILQSRETILIVEDNEEMRIFVADMLKENYNIVLASQGKEALQYLRQQVINLIITDVMMPVMDGFELLKEVKTHIEFSHIPVVVLTARSTFEARIDGLSLGADAYIDKPFSIDLLKTQIKNLLDNRNNIRMYYLNTPMANVKTMAYSKTDEEFLIQLDNIINEHIDDVDLNVEKIADMMNLSRPTLYRKISAISQVTPNKFINIIRLKKAAELLQKGEMKVYEVSEAVGFSSQSYFSRAFLEQFGITPSQYIKTCQTND